MGSRSADRSWARSGIDEAAFRALTDELAAHELWSLLLGVLQARARARTPASLLEQWERDGFTELAAVDLRTALAVDAELLRAAEAFEAVELSPVAPLGVCSAVALASQNKVLSALRGTEVVSDPTNVLALECARRLRRDSSGCVRLVTSQRVVRAQEPTSIPARGAAGPCAGSRPPPQPSRLASCSLGSGSGLLAILAL